MERLPQHVAIIMDGNGRWAHQRGLPRAAGHARGAEAVRGVVDACCENGIPYLTLFAFSSENWGRPPAEVSALMKLLVRFFQAEMPRMKKGGIRLHVIGEIDRLPPRPREVLAQCVEKTRTHDRLHLTLALSYGGRNELVRAAQRLGQQLIAGELTVEQITETCFSDALDTRGIPDPDLLIRTSGEQRLSNFLLWQLAYAELYFTPVLWPDFDRQQFDLALADFARRERRFGLTEKENSH